MKCEEVRKQIDSHLDNPHAMEDDVSKHVTRCNDCTEYMLRMSLSATQTNETTSCRPCPSSASLTSYDNGSLSYSEARKVAMHVCTCPSCTKKLAVIHAKRLEVRESSAASPMLRALQAADTWFGGLRMLQVAQMGVAVLLVTVLTGYVVQRFIATTPHPTTSHESWGTGSPAPTAHDGSGASGNAIPRGGWIVKERGWDIRGTNQGDCVSDTTTDEELLLDAIPQEEAVDPSGKTIEDKVQSADKDEPSPTGATDPVPESNSENGNDH